MHQQRARREVPHIALIALRPLFRFSYTRDAYVLRAVGNRLGPVLRPKVRRSAAEAGEMAGESAADG